METQIVCGFCGTKYEDWTKAADHEYSCPKRKHYGDRFLSGGIFRWPELKVMGPEEIRQNKLIRDFSEQIREARKREAQRLLADQVFTS